MTPIRCHVPYLELSHHILVSCLSATVEVTLELPLEVTGLLLLTLLLSFTTSLLLPQVVRLMLQATKLSGEWKTKGGTR